MRCAVRARQFVDLIDDEDPTLLSWTDIPSRHLANPAYVLLRSVTPVVELRCTVEELLAEPVTLEAELKALRFMQHCRAVDQTLVLWLQTLPDDWKHVETHYQAPEILSSDPDISTLLTWPHDSTINMFKDQWVLFHFSTCCIYRAFVQAAILRCGAWAIGFPVQSMTPSDLGQVAGPLQGPLIEASNALLSILDTVCRSVHYVGPPPFPLVHVAC